ncbi:TIGR01457 family HAD-type hydrolase [Oenococcus oeni]|uniref:TIGR01457 family HAD-type hydrolase n=1 Tax=Oenococcus oeni TaxID=1247 RepID=UPI001EF9F8F4|nr:TIGR01457 family HAD-type hydrolase [Oenococcus oeni]
MITLKKYSGYLIDLDGTIYEGSRSLPKAQEFMQRLISSEKSYLFVTNNATRTPEQIANDLQQNHHIPTTAEHVFSSALATADYLKSSFLNQKRLIKILLVGEAGLIQALSKTDFKIVNSARENPDYCVVGLNRKVTYDCLKQAVFSIQHGAKFIATNTDALIPTQEGRIPGAGALVQFIKYATKTDPVIIGKPSRIIMEKALKRASLSKENSLMIGDGLITDIQAAKNVGMDSLLTLTGLSTVSTIKALGIEPTYVVNDLSEWKV